MTKWEANPYWNGALVDWYPMEKKGLPLGRDEVDPYH